MNIVLFLGAGFSKPFGFPVMSEFFSAVDGNPRLTSDEKRFVGELLLDARRANSFLKSSPTNLEDVLSFAVMRDRLGLSQGNSESRVLRVLQAVFTHASGARDHWEKYDVFRQFLGFDPTAQEAPRLSIITTNYDLNAECVLWRHGLQCRPGFDWKQVSDGGGYSVRGQLYSEGGLPVFKLHGSVNWFLPGAEGALSVEGRIVSVGHHGDGALPLACTGNWDSPTDPVLVPPSFLKPDLVGPLGEIWANAASALKEAHAVVFVGYSFPDSDTEMMYFLATGLSENSLIRRIVLVDPDVDGLLARLSAPGSRVGEHFRSLLDPVASGWTDARLELS